VQLSSPERLVGVDIADSRYQSLIQQRAFEAGPPRPDTGDHPIEIECRVQGISGDVRYRDGQIADHILYREAAERSLVDETQLRIAVDKLDPHSQVRFVSGTGRLDAHLPTHPQVSEQRFPVTQIEPEVLPAASDGSDLPATEPGGEVQLASEVTAY
jgi:hypothetical protein